ncbi:MAG: tetratricopeptide repeat protein, partial [Bdellovibrionales bacterium]|nr:tetratricopeptide repeat protein [Bdellovibrionales bacterium]
MSKLWLVKDQKGRIQGPYTEEEICNYIHEEHFKGSALIALYPSGKWKSISSHPGFYKAILKSLNEQLPPQKEKLKEEPLPEIEDEPPEEDVLEPTVIIPKDKLKRKRRKIKIRSSHHDYSDDFEEKDFLDKEEKDLQGIRRFRLPLIIIAGCALAVLVFLPEEKKDSSSTRQVRLLSPKKRGPLLNPMEMKKEFKQAAFHYKKDTLSSYLKAQRQIVQMLERTKSHRLGYAQLCLIHLELWPFAYQDSKDQEARRKVQDRISQMDKGGVAAGLCSAVNAFMSRKYEKSLMIVESSLNALAQKPDESPVFLYYVKAKALTALQRGQEAQNYLRGIYGFLPNWIAPYMLEARISYEAQNFSNAAKVYQKVLSLFPQHPSAALHLGVIEYNHFKKLQKSEKRLKSVLSNLKELLDPRILIEAYTVLTQISLSQNDKEEALKYAKKAYALDPANAVIADIIFKLSGTTQIKKGKIKTRQLIYKGDILVDQGQCNEAQEYYKKAYIADKKKNALAAVRMAKCFWKQGMSGEAIQWLKRATAADPKMMEAYFLLADYYSTRYLFNEASDVLRSASQKNPNSYEVFKGYALLTFRQQNYNVAINYAKKSLSFYTSDVEVYVLLAKSYRALKEFSEAYKYASKAVEEDVNSVPGQISFALARGSAYGFSHGEKYFNELIQNFPVIMEYRQALGEYYFEEQKFEQAKNIFINILAQSPNF